MPCWNRPLETEVNHKYPDRTGGYQGYNWINDLSDMKHRANDSKYSELQHKLKNYMEDVWEKQDETTLFLYSI